MFCDRFHILIHLIQKGNPRNFKKKVISMGFVVFITNRDIFAAPFFVADLHPAQNMCLPCSICSIKKRIDNYDV
ncbi:hypothetical protein M2273_001967 [Mucilaginibacter lappiensis]